MGNYGLFSALLGSYQDTFEQGLKSLEDANIIPRIWEQDYTVWKPDPAEISNRLGWLRVWEEMESHIGELETLAFAAQHEGMRKAILLGMGGSSLAPELFGKTFPGDSKAMQLHVLDSTDPEAVAALEKHINYAQTLFFVSTKSGGTVETFSFMKFFYRRAVAELGADGAGAHFIAITDPGSGLADVARQYHFRATLLNNPDIGGRYSALSYFGLAPAAFSGVNLARLIASARKMAADCQKNSPLAENPAAVLGAVLGGLANQGRDKVTFLLSPRLASFGDWVEQLIAESTGKEGKGILPVPGEGLAPPEYYGNDRLFVHTGLSGESLEDPALQRLEAAGHPVISMELEDIYDLGGQFLLWELATAIAGRFLSINPFDQPNVESAKVSARKMVAAYQQSGSLPQPPPDLEQEGIQAFGTDQPTLNKALREFLAQAKPGDYIAIQAFLQPLEATTTALKKLRSSLLAGSHLATTLGYGPRFLHSTGQLHKGDRGNGLFIQLTSASPHDLPIPDQMDTDHSSLSFGVLKLAQALGDQEALQNAGRRVIRFHIQGDVDEGIARLVAALGE